MNDPSNDGSVAHKLLLADLENWSQSFWKNEAAGEGRIKFFVGLATAVGSGLSVLYRTGLESGAIFDELLSPLALAGLGGVLVFGLVTFARMVRRDQVTDEYKEWADEIRRELLGVKRFERIYGREKKAPSRRDLWNGGLTSMMLVMNGLIAAILGGFLTREEGSGAVLSASLASFAVALWGQVAFTRWRSDKATKAHGDRETLRKAAAR